MRFTPRDGILFGVLCIGFAVYSALNKGELWQMGAALAIGLAVGGVSAAALLKRRRRGK